MPLTKPQLEQDLKTAMLARDQIKMDTLRMLKSAIKYLEIEKGKDADEAMLLEVVAREVKKRREAAESFKQGGKAEAAAKEETEAAILVAYLPTQLSEAEVQKLVTAAVAKSGAKVPSDMGKVMGILMPQVKGKADGALVSKLVKAALGA